MARTMQHTFWIDLKSYIQYILTNQFYSHTSSNAAAPLRHFCPQDESDLTENKYNEKQKGKIWKFQPLSK